MSHQPIWQKNVYKTEALKNAEGQAIKAIKAFISLQFPTVDIPCLYDRIRTNLQHSEQYFDAEKFVFPCNSILISWQYPKAGIPCKLQAGPDICSMVQQQNPVTWQEGYRGQRKHIC